MPRTFLSVTATAAERRTVRAGDDIIARPDVVMDRAFTVAAGPAAVWPWIVQLGKGRAGWYFPALVERCIPGGRRGLHVIDPRWQDLGIGDKVPDWGGPSAWFEVSVLEPPTALEQGPISEEKMLVRPAR